MAKLTTYNIAICLLVGVAGFSYGFGFVIFVTSIGQPGFYQYFNLDPTSTYTANILGAVNALFNLGLALGALTQGRLADVVGRKRAFAIAGLCSLVGAALLAGSVAIGMLIAVRLLHGFGLGMLICLVPLYLTEIAPPRSRGLLTGLTTFSFGMGYLSCSWIAVGTFYAKDITVQWRVPLALATVGPLGFLLGLPFIPESPRYLAMIGKDGEAWEILRKLHQDPNDREDSSARAEYTQIVRQVELDKQEDVGYIQLFKKPSWRRRTLLAMFLQFAFQSSGILGITNFVVLIFHNLGLDGVWPLIVYGIYASVATPFVVLSIFIMDRVGRRTMLLVGYPAIAACMLLEGLLQWKYLGTNHRGGLIGCVFIMFVHISVVQQVEAPSFVWASEVFPTTIRAKGISLAFFSYFVGAITYTTPAALAYKNVKYNMYFLYMGLCLVSWVVIYFFIPETKQISMEEIGALFGDEVAVHITADGQGIVEEGKMIETEGVTVEQKEVA